MLKGVTKALKKDQTIYYRSSITYSGKHISLGSFDSEEQAHQAYLCGLSILEHKTTLLELLEQTMLLSFDKVIVLANFRDNGLYIKNPIYLCKQYFLYYLDAKTALKFDIEDLFFYSTHRIQQRNGYLFVADYGMQINLLSRYGIRNYSIEGVDYEFANGDRLDYRYHNIKVLHPYYGVRSYISGGLTKYKATIHLRGNFLIGRYDTAIEAAIAYNKAVDLVIEKGCKKSFSTNYILDLAPSQYAKIYHELHISKKIRHLCDDYFTS